MSAPRSEQTSRNDETTQQHAGAEAESSKPHGSWGGIQYAVEQQGWSSREAADFVLQMAEEGLNPRRAQGLPLRRLYWKNTDTVIAKQSREREKPKLRSKEGDNGWAS